MKTLQLKIVKTKIQYDEYSDRLIDLLEIDAKTTDIKEEIELLTLLIEDYYKKHYPLDELNPIELLETLMQEHNLKAKDLTAILGVRKSLVAAILSYKTGLSRETIQILAEHFGLSQEAFNKPYKLKSASSAATKNKGVGQNDKIYKSILLQERNSNKYTISI